MSVIAESNTKSNSSIVPTVKGLEKLFEELNEKFFDSALSSSDVVISLSQKGTRAATGCTSQEKIWEDGAKNCFYEINIFPEYLNRPYTEICATMLHEMCHLFNIAKGTLDSSRNGQYHNKEFKNCAESHGLVVEKDPKYGFSITTLNADALEYVSTLDLTAFGLFRKSNEKIPPPAGAPSKSTKSSSTRKYICPVCNISIRATKEVNVRCIDCEKTFVLEGDAEEPKNFIIPVVEKAVTNKIPA